MGRWHGGRDRCHHTAGLPESDQKDFFRAYKDFTDVQIDTIEILLAKLYARFGITDSTDYSAKKPTDFPIMEDFYKLCEEEFMTYDNQRKYLYTEETLQQVFHVRGIGK